MAFDFSTYRRLLYQNALDDAINMLGKQGPPEYKDIADQISSQLSAWRKSSAWKTFRHPKKSNYHKNIVRNLYQSGLAASKGEKPPALIVVNPWRTLIMTYGVIILLLGTGLYFLIHKPVCPKTDSTKDLSIIIDKFGSVHQPFLQKLGFGGETFEKQIEGALSFQNISVKVHPVSVDNRDQAKSRCAECGANMLIWGNVEYGDSIRAYLYHYLNQENYDAYRVKYGIPEAEEHYKNIFGLRTGQWIGQVECLVKLFQGLIAKEKFEESQDPKVKEAAIKEANRLFSDLASCAIDDSLKLFALQCQGWSELKMNNEDAALLTFNAILEIDPDNSLALNNSGMLLLKQNDNLHAQLRFEKILETNDVPYIRIANAEALSKLNRGDEAKKEIERVEKSGDYRVRKDLYDQKIKTIPTASLYVHPVVSSPSTSLSLSEITTQFNGGETSKAIKNLDILSSKADPSFSTEDLIIMSELYKNAGAIDKATMFNSKVAEMGVVVPAHTTTLSKAIKSKVNHH